MLKLQKKKIRAMETILHFERKESMQLWHLCTDGESSGIIFRTNEDFVYGMNMVGVCASVFRGKVVIYTFQLMSNHFHFVMEGMKGDVEAFFESLKLRMRRYLLKKNRGTEISKISYKLFEIKDITYLRNVVAYVNRNGYVVDCNVTPFSYEWGANRYFFNECARSEDKLPIDSIGKRARFGMFHTRDVDFPNNYYLTNGYISPLCYCNLRGCEEIFNNAHHYFSAISRRVESFANIAREIGEMISYTDEEMILVAYNYSNKKFNKSNLNLLDKNEKIELAKIMHFDYNAPNKQINRVLKMDYTVLNALFPLVKGK